MRVMRSKSIVDLGWSASMKKMKIAAANLGGPLRERRQMAAIVVVAGDRGLIDVGDEAR